MEETVQKLLAPGKGILAADESTKTISKRFAALGLTSTPELNRKYREMLFTTPGIEEYISGIIMFDETVRQKIPIHSLIVSGIKVDEGLELFDGTEEEITKGLEGLETRLKEYSDMGLKFTKWRGVIKISETSPSEEFLIENMERMAKFAKISQKNGFVPIVEPEILLDGNHTTIRCAEITTKTLKKLFEKLNLFGVDVKNVILKTSMVLPGKDSGAKIAPHEVAQVTLRVLRESVPGEVPGIVFLSGGQTPDEATNNLNRIVRQKGDATWELSFSFARALQEEAMSIWRGLDENVVMAQEVFLKRLKLVAKARRGEL